MREFVLPFKPEELLAQPGDSNRLWAQDLPPVDEWSSQEANKALDKLVGRVLSSGGRDIAEDESFSLLFALLQAWPRLEDATRPRVGELLVDAAKRLQGEAEKLKRGSAKQKDKDAAQNLRNASRVAVFFLKWAAERYLKQAPEAALTARRGGKGSRRGEKNDAEKEAALEEAKEAQRTLERSRCAVLGELPSLIGKGAMPSLWMGDQAWQQVAQCVSDAGFAALDSADALKHRESRQFALRCVAEPLLQEGHQHSNLLVSTVSKLMHGLRGGEGGAPFAADVLLLAHTTPLPRLFLVDLPSHCNATELSSQGAFQRSLATFLVAVTERLPHVVLANISILLPLLDVDCYPIRSAIVESISGLLAAEGKKLPSGAHSAPAPVARDVEGGEEGAEGAEVAAQGEEPAEAAAPVAAQGDAPIAYFSIANSTKKDLLETLLTRSLDKSVWVRYRVLHTLVGLATNTRVAALPRDQWSRVLEIATRRMQDSASTTRKASMQLVRALIEHHPYGPALQGSGDERQKAQQLLQEVNARFQKLQAEEAAEAEQAIAASEGRATMEIVEDEGGEEEQPSKRRRFKGKTVTDQTVANDVERILAEDEGSSKDDMQAERERQREALRRMKDCYTQRLKFVELIDSAETRLRGLLASRTVSDVIEAISVVVELRLKNVPAATRAFDQVLGLVWSRQASVKDAAVEAFNRMHLEGRDSADAVQSLLEMYQKGCTGGSWTYTHLASVQELIQVSAEKSYINVKKAIPEFVAALSGPCSSMALRALTSLGAASAQELLAQLPKIAEVCGPDGPAEGKTSAEKLERARLVCHLLQRLHACVANQLTDQAWEHMWALTEHAIFVVVSCFARGDVPPQWFGAAQAAMDLSFELSMESKAATVAQRCPDKLWERVLNRMLCAVLTAPASEAAAPLCDGDASGEEHAAGSAAEAPATDADGDAEAAGAGDIVPAAGPEAVNVSGQQVGCAVFLAGHLALRMLVYLETLQSALKRKRLAEEDKRIAEVREKNSKKPKKGKKGGEKEEEEEVDQATSMGGVGQEERENDAFLELAESGIVFGSRSLLDKIKPLLFACLLDPTLRTDPMLRRLGAISLCKYMTVSKKFCQDNLQLLFSILFPKGSSAGALSTAPGDDPDAVMGGANTASLMEDTTLRQALLVAVGDLLFRHPNVVEPWTGKLYASLGSTPGAEGGASAELRLTALLVLTHLVLNDMLKPRAVLLVRALWLTACVHEPTARVARILFQELSKRSTNVVYNLLPQIISILPDHQDNSGQLKGGAEERVQFIMQFVEKEKHIEGLIEKLSIRLAQSADASGPKGATQQQAQVLAQPQIGGDDEDADDAMVPKKASEAVCCLSHALGSMNYTDRCVLRLHDVIVVRKALHTALSYHSVARDCILGIVEKFKKPKVGAKGGAEGLVPEGDPPAAADGAGGGKGFSAAAMAAIDAIEQTVQGLARGKEDDPDAAAAGEEGPAAADGKGASSRGAAKSGRGAGKRKPEESAAAEADDNPGFDEADDKAKKAGGKGKGRGRGRGRGAAAAADAAPEDDGGSKRGGRGGASGAPGGKKRKAKGGDDEDYEG